MNNITDNLPIFVRIAEGIKDCILSGELKEGEQITSTTRIANDYNINIATVNKGFNLLVDEGILYKKRGIGMFVTEGAVDRLIKERRDVYKEKYIIGALEEAKRLRYSLEDLEAMVREVFEQEQITDIKKESTD